MGFASTIAVSGLNVASLRLQVAAGNIANAWSDGPLPDTPNPENFPAAYTPRRVNQVQNAAGGTDATVTAVSPAFVSVFDPTAPFADSRGMVASPNVDLGNELVQTLIARLSYAANAKVIRVDTQMGAMLFDITA
ncbi:MAG TPA: flagellar biosynthesis protein FlgC [Pseudolabrys sp.]|nr:flagellar biosynthesis protein FlgC [Pseudolabrys sp.]